MKLINISTPTYPDAFTMVDDEDYDFLNQWKWHIHDKRSRYAARNEPNKETGKIRILYMHRVLMPTSAFVDHVNCDRLDNRRSNLRSCSHLENNLNRLKSKNPMSSKFKGVCFNKRKRVFMSYINFDNKRVYLGTFKNDLSAAKAYNDAAEKHFGKFANLNIIDSGASI